MRGDNMALAQTILGGIKDLAGSYLEKKKAENGIYTVKAANITPRANQYATAMNDAVNRLNSIEKFSYDQKNDPLYQQYAEMYQKNAKLAMQDTVGQATALTGGYGSSYAETAGQAMYNQAMSGLNDKALDLYRTSLDAYNSYADLAAKQAGAATSAFNADQSAIDTEVSAAQWNANFEEQQRQKAADIAMENQKLRQQQLEFGLNYALDAAKTGYQMYSDTRDFNWNKAVDERNFGYQKERDLISDEQVAKELTYKYDALHSSEAQAAKELAYKYDALHSSEAQSAKDLAYRYAAAGLNADGTLSAAERERLSYQYGENNYKYGSPIVGSTGKGKSISKVVYADLGYPESKKGSDGKPLKSSLESTLTPYLDNINRAGSDAERAEIISELYASGKITDDFYDRLVKAYRL